MTNNKNYTDDEFIEELKKLVENVDLTLKKYKQTINILNADIIHILQCKKVIDQMIEFDKNLTHEQKKIVNQRMVFDAKNHFFAMIGTILRIFNKINCTAEPLKKLFSYKDSDELKKLRAFFEINKEKITIIESSKIIEESDEIAWEKDSYDSKYIKSIKSRFSKFPDFLETEYKKLDKIFLSLNLKKFRDEHFAHLDLSIVISPTKLSCLN